MRVIICTLFLVLAIFLNSFQLSSQAGREQEGRPPRGQPIHPVGVPILPERVDLYSEDWKRVKANQVIELPNGVPYKALFDGLLKIFYRHPHGVIYVNDNERISKILPPSDGTGGGSSSTGRRSGPSRRSGSSV